MSCSFPSPLQTKRTELHPDTQKREERRSPLCWDRLSSLFSFKISGIYQNRTAGQLKLLPMKWPPPYSPSFPPFSFSFSLSPSSPLSSLSPLLLPSSSLSALFSLPLSAPTFLFFLPLFTTTAPTFPPPVRHTLLLLWLFYRLSTRASTLFNYKRL